MSIVMRFRVNPKFPRKFTLEFSAKEMKNIYKKIQFNLYKNSDGRIYVSDVHL